MDIEMHREIGSLLNADKQLLHRLPGTLMIECLANTSLSLSSCEMH